MMEDVTIFNFEGHPPRRDASGRGYRAQPMGPAPFVRDAISTALDVDWSDPRRGVLDGGAYVLEFDLGAGDPGEVLSQFTLHVRGEGDVVGLIAHLCEVNGWAALDGATGEFMDFEDLPRAEAKWRRRAAGAAGDKAPDGRGWN